jgi:hypothetical protein
MEKEVKSKIADLINRLKRIATFGPTGWNEIKTAAVRIFGGGESTVSFISVGTLKEFKLITNSLYKKNVPIQKNYTLQDFIYKLIGLLRVLDQENRDANIDDWNALVNSLLKMPDVTAEIVLPIYGVLLANSPIELGAFTIYTNEALKIKYPELNSSRERIRDKEYFVAQTVTSKSLDKCREDAEKNFFIFENVANFITAGFHKTYKISLFDSRFFEQINHLAFTNNQILSGGKTLHNFEPVKIANPYFSDPINGSGKVWDLITITKNDLQKKILESIEWSGKASVETDDNKALLLYLISIEAILNYAQNTSLYIPTTISLADSVAFLLGTTKDSRRQLAKTITELYALRSGIVHGSVRQVPEHDLQRAFIPSHRIVKKILFEEPYKSLSSKKMLSEYLLKEKKYEMGEV